MPVGLRELSLNKTNEANYNKTIYIIKIFPKLTTMLFDTIIIK